MESLNLFLLIRKWFMVFSQIVGALFCIYFIIKVQEYEITSNFLKIIFPSITTKINIILASVGTYILIIPFYY